MTVRTYVDNASTKKLSGSVTSGATTITLDSLTGLPSSFPYAATIAMGTASAEQVLVTAAPGGTSLTVTRNYNGQGAFSHSSADTFDHSAIAKDYQEANAHVNATTGVHGVVGAVVGTTDAQVLTNKSLTSPTITGTGTAALASLTVSGAAAVGSLTVGGVAGGPVPAGSISVFAGLNVPTGWLECDGSAVSRATYAALYAAMCKAEKTGSLVAGGVSGNWTGTITVADSSGWVVGDRVSGPGIDLTNDTVANVISAIPNGTTIVLSSRLVGIPTPYSNTTSQTYVVAPFGNGDGSTTFNLPNPQGRTLRGAGAASTGEGPGVKAGSDTHTHPLSTNGWADLFFSTGKIDAQKVSQNFTGTSAATYSGSSTAAGAETSAVALGGATDSGSTLPSYLTVRFIIKT